jgi:hypothetical protein
LTTDLLSEGDEGDDGEGDDDDDEDDGELTCIFSSHASSN